MIGITLTGADQSTPLMDLVRLARMGAEVGLLYTAHPKSRPRYPTREWIANAAWALNRAAALHVCGEEGRMQLLQGKLDEMTRLVDRIQVNGRELTSDYVHGVCNRYHTKTIITQHRSENNHLIQLAMSNHAVLVDDSGGSGLLPAKWARPETEKAVGFAGGLRPDNLEIQLPMIAAAAGQRQDWWIDMESSLRDHRDIFQSNKAFAAVSAWKKWQEAPAVVEPRLFHSIAPTPVCQSPQCNRRPLSYDGNTSMNRIVYSCPGCFKQLEVKATFIENYKAKADPETIAATDAEE